MFKQLSKEQKTILLVLSLINFFNYVDRQVVFSLLHLIKQEFGSTDFQLGLLGTVFMLVHSIASLPLGILADRFSRKAVIVFGAIFWSLTSFATGLATSFKALLGIRSAVGIGEASYAPAATAMISDNFPANLRAQAQGAFNVGMFAGGTIGLMLGGLLAYYFHSWRLAFFIVSIPGFILAVLTLKLKDRKVIHPGGGKNWSVLFKNPAYVWLLVGGIFSTFASGAWISWGIEFVVRYKNYNLRDASMILGVILLVAGIIGVYLGSFLADWLQKKFIWGRSMAVSASHLLAVPFVWLVLEKWSSGIWFFLFFFIGAAFWSFYHGPATAVMHDIVPKKLWSTAFALYILIIHLLGDTLAPAAIGRLSDRYSLLWGMRFTILMIFISGLAFVVMGEIIRRRKINLNHEEAALVLTEEVL